MNTPELIAMTIQVVSSILIVMIGLILLRQVNLFLVKLTKHFGMDEVRPEPREDLREYGFSAIHAELVKEQQVLSTQETVEARERKEKIEKNLRGGWLQFGDMVARALLKAKGDMALENILKAVLDLQYPHLNPKDTGLEIARGMKTSLERTLAAFVELGYITKENEIYRLTTQGRELFEKVLQERMAFDEKFLALYSTTPVVALGCQGNRCVFVIQKDSDDASEVSGGSTCAFSAEDENIYLGKCYSDEPITAGFRFVDIEIPVKAVITKAYLEFVADGPYLNTLSLAICAEDEVEVQTFSATHQPKDRTMTDSSVLWQFSSDDAWQLGQVERTPDISSLIQTIIDKPSWKQGSSMAILIRGLANGDKGAHRRIIGYRRAKLSREYQAPQLIIEFDPVQP